MRNSLKIKKKKKVKPKKDDDSQGSKPRKRISGYDYRSWDKLDIVRARMLVFPLKLDIVRARKFVFPLKLDIVRARKFAFPSETNCHYNNCEDLGYQ